ncbi:MAG: multicopper oxidase family protein [bacterium]
MAFSRLPLFENNVNRRSLLRGLGGVGAGAILASLPACSSRMSDDATVTPEGSPVASPSVGQPSAELRSKNGLLQANLRIAPGMVAFGTGVRWALTVNGQTPGPTLFAAPGDHLSITLDNQSGHSTNLHTHGLQVSPTGKADNPFIEIPNGTAYVYEIDIPKRHPGGTFWYHPHFHHHVAEQLFAGFFGLIVVEDAVDALPAVAGAVQRTLILHDTRIGATESAVMSTTPMAQRDGREGDVLVNGLREPAFEARSDRLERWRVLNASASRFYRLSLDGHAFFVIATDANRLAEPARVETLTLVPGERVEVLVQHERGGSFALKSLPVSRGSMGTNPESKLATFNVSEGGSAPPLPATVAAFSDLSTVVPLMTRQVVFSMQGQMGGARFLIDGKEFDSSRVDVKVARGTTEDWVIRNTSPMDHPFHLHVWPFQVIEQSAAGTPMRAWKDVVNVPANGSVRLRIPFLEITGKTVFHCHILDHEDAGMMAVIEVS